MSVPKRRVRTSARKSPPDGTSDQNSGLRSARSTLNELPTLSRNTVCAGAELPRIGRRRRERPFREARGEFTRVQANERGVERCAQRGAAGVELHLPALHFGGGREDHLAAADEDDGRRAAGHVGGEHAAVRQHQLEVLRRDAQVRGPEPAGGVELQAVEAVDEPERLQAGDAPAGGFFARVHLPCAEAPAAAGLDERLEHESRSAARHRHAITLLDHDARGAGRQP